MKRTVVYLLTLLLSVALPAQKVGLVLSGGGARGLTHIGIIHALEDNGIPIDYVAGTSMGAIVASLYAMGYSPREMVDFISSPDFNKAYTGTIDENNLYYIKRNDPSPEFLTVKADLGADSIAFSPSLPTNLINPVYMNLMFMETFAQPTAACDGDFDKLFVPFRCVASNVYEKRPLIFNHGDLGRAVRASMTFPFVFKPIEVDGELAYDGGIFNNFPVDIMKEDFHPDFIIGSVTAYGQERPEPDDVIGQLETMIMARTNYALPDTNGVLMKFDLKGEVGLLDFHKVKQLHDLGYETTLRLIDSIRSKVPRTVPLDSVRARREAFKATFPDIRFRNIYVRGATDEQRQYIKREIRDEDEEYFTLDELRQAYFRLLSDNSISEILPTAIYNPFDRSFDLQLDVSLENNVSLMLGGALSTGNISQVYYGFYFNHLGRRSIEVLLDGQLGRTYNNVQLMARLNFFASAIPVSVRILGAYSTIDYYKQDYLFSGSSEPSLNRERESFIKLKTALPFLSQQKAEFGIGVGRITDTYVPGGTLDILNPLYSENDYALLGGSVFFGQNSLNSPQYATRGRAQYVLAQVFSGTSIYTPADPAHGHSSLMPIVETSPISWLQVMFKDQRYLPLSKKITLGTYAEAFYSSRNLTQDFTATMMQANAFTPTASSTFTYNSYFRSNKYIAAGLIPIYNLSSIVSVRLEGYAFLPLRPILQDSNYRPYYGSYFSRLGHMEELSVVGRFSTIVASAYLSHNSSPLNPWGIGITVGWQLFNTRFIER